MEKRPLKKIWDAIRDETNLHYGQSGQAENDLITFDLANLVTGVWNLQPTKLKLKPADLQQLDRIPT